MIETGIYFDDIHSYYDLGLILSSADIPPAKPKTTYVDIPGGDGSVDLTEAHGDVKYSDRDCKFTFTVLSASPGAWEEKKTEVSNALNGKVCKIILDKDSDYYYEGRCTVDDWQSDRNLNQIVIAAKVYPYKRKVVETIITDTLTATAHNVMLPNGRQKVCPMIICSADNTTVVFGGNTFSFSAGTHKNLNIQLDQGVNIASVSGTGTIKFQYREGDL